MKSEREKTSDWLPEYDCDRFSLHLQCADSACGEIAIMAGYTDFVEFFGESEDGFDHWGESLLVPQTVFPAPPLFHLPPNVPETVAKQLRLAFQLYWTDLPSCLARVRTSVELMLDDQKVPSQKLSPKSGKVAPINLSERIETFKTQTGDQEAADSLDALRLVGNLGTHETTVSAEALFDAMDVYEDVLIKIYSMSAIQAKRTRLIATKGRY